ncbi:Sister chromatid cohesion protein DCC1 [Bagarius yarrelli]|uniref:Sister chromatid cohesion protein DCC1 n=1 Tax=Bagarius yarrelli TaxID=175774 RepID=A0A556V1U1_BAGYA|nr:Sister chromatid cohesion protein DCC1 [Bagarius yarrelli]
MPHRYFLTIRGDKDEHAVLCSEDKTYDLKIADTSNLLLFLPGCKTPEQLSDSESEPKLIHAQIWGYANSYWELRCQRPKLKKLKKLLMENPYDGPPIGAQGESSELVKVIISMRVLLAIVLASALSFCSSLDVNPKPCMQARYNNAHATFLKRHLPDGVPKTWDQNVWNALLKQIKTCGRPTQSFFHENDREHVNAVCTKAGGKQHTANLCISKEKFSFVTVRVNVNEGLCGIRSIRNETKHIILGCDEVQDKCRPVHFEGNPENLMPNNNQPDCGERSGPNSGIKASMSESLLVFTLVAFLYNL